MIGLLTCLVLVALAGVSAELVRASCRRRLATPLVRPQSAAPVAVPAAAVSTPAAEPMGLAVQPVAA